MKFSKRLPIIVLTTALTLMVVIFALPAITGREWPTWSGLRGKTIWEFAQLIVVPVSLALIAYLFSNSQRMEEREIARAQREQDLQVADQRRRNDYEIALNREREEALQSYLTVMTGLLLDRDLTDAKVATIAQARTASVLPRLDGKRRAAVLRFLTGTDLITAKRAVIKLSGADLSGMPAEGMNLAGVDLMGANLSDSKLAHCTLRDSDLRMSDLSNVDLTNADLFNASFQTAILTGTIFSGALIYKADFSPPPEKPHMSLQVQKGRARREQEDWLAMLQQAQFSRARYDYSTKWPPGFDRERSGAIDESD